MLQICIAILPEQASDERIAPRVRLERGKWVSHFMVAHQYAGKSHCLERRYFRRENFRNLTLLGLVKV
jgi:hypothetical protein